MFPFKGGFYLMMTRSGRIVFLVLLVLIMTLPGLGQAEMESGFSQGDANAAFSRLQSFLAGMRTMEADFVQRVVNPSQGTPEESKGKFYAFRPGKFRWDYESPYVQNIISDGNEIFFYEPDLKQVSVANWSRLRDSPAAFFVSQDPLETVFDWSVIPDPALRYPSVRLKPKKEGDVKHIDVLLSPGGDTLLKLSILDVMGNLSHFYFHQSRLNVDIPEDRFQFQVPDGVDVVQTESIKP